MWLCRDTAFLQASHTGSSWYWCLCAAAQVPHGLTFRGLTPCARLHWRARSALAAFCVDVTLGTVLSRHCLLCV